MKNKLSIIQEENSDCGIAALASIIKYYHGYIPLEVLRINTNTSENGTSAYDIIKYANKIGFYAYGEKVEELNIKKLPVIAHLKLDNGYYHFVVIYNITKDYLVIMDPSEGFKKIKKDIFLKQFTNVIINFNNISVLPIYNNNRFIKKELIKYIRDNNKKILLLLLLNIIILLLSTILNVEIKILELKKSYIYFLLIIIIVNELTQYLKSIIAMNYNIEFNNRIISYFINHIFKLPSSYLKLKQKGEISTRFNELNELSNNIINFIIEIFFLIVTILLLLMLILYINKTLSIYALLITIIYLLINYKVYRSLYYIIKHYINMEENYNSNIIDYINKIITIKHLHSYDFFINNVKSNLFNRNKIFKQIEKKLFIITLINNIFFNTIQLLIIYYLLTNRLNLSNSLLILLLINYYINLIKRLTDFFPKIIMYKNIINKNNEFLSYESEEKEQLYLDNLNIDINKLTYIINNNKILNNINFIIKENSKIFISGPTGVGKSTFLKILNNEITNYCGSILFNKTNIKDYNISKIVSFTSQEEDLLNDTIRNNLLLGKNIDTNYLNDIIKITRIDRIINTIGMDNVLVNSNSLSGGEKNRLILARSLIHSKKIIILDEVLKEVNYDLEVSIIKDVLAYFKDRIIIYVSHKDLGYLFDDVLTFRKETNNGIK